MEIAVGEYGADVGKGIKAALKKYYEISSRCIELDSTFDDNGKLLRRHPPFEIGPLSALPLRCFAVPSLNRSAVTSASLVGSCT